MVKKIISVLTLSMLLYGVTLSAAQIILVDGKKYTGDDNTVLCLCPHDEGSCKCAFIVPSPSSKGVNVMEQLRSLPTYKGEDDDYLYFEAAIIPETQPPQFDITHRGKRIVKLSKTWVLDKFNK